MLARIFFPETMNSSEAFDSLAKFLKEGKIEFLQKAESQLQIAKESRYRIVAVVGLFDKGSVLRLKTVNKKAFSAKKNARNC